MFKFSTDLTITDRWPVVFIQRFWRALHLKQIIHLKAPAGLSNQQAGSRWECRGEHMYCSWSGTSAPSTVPVQWLTLFHVACMENLDCYNYETLSLVVRVILGTVVSINNQGTLYPWPGIFCQWGILVHKRWPRHTAVSVHTHTRLSASWSNEFWSGSPLTGSSHNCWWSICLTEFAWSVLLILLLRWLSFAWILG